MNKLYKTINKLIYNEPQAGKAHSLNSNDIDSQISKYLRMNYYNVKLSNIDVFNIKKIIKENGNSIQY